MDDETRKRIEALQQKADEQKAAAEKQRKEADDFAKEQLEKVHRQLERNEDLLNEGQKTATGRDVPRERPTLWNRIKERLGWNDPTRS